MVAGDGYIQQVRDVVPGAKVWWVGSNRISGRLCTCGFLAFQTNHGLMRFSKGATKNPTGPRGGVPVGSCVTMNALLPPSVAQPSQPSPPSLVCITTLKVDCWANYRRPASVLNYFADTLTCDFMPFRSVLCSLPVPWRRERLKC